LPRSIKIISTLICKDIKLDLRSINGAVTTLLLVLILSVFFSLGLQRSFLGPTQILKIIPITVWGIIIVVCAATFERSYDSEIQNEAWIGVKQTNISLNFVYLSKFIVGVIKLILTWFVATIIITQMLNCYAQQFFTPFFLGVVFLGSVGLSSLITLLIGATSANKIKGVLFSVLFIPLAMPLIISLQELTALSLVGIDMGAYTWLAFLILCDLVYLLVGINLYEFLFEA
jgi:ABC-type transport system involved in cytochrome c biogenesis permease component